MLITVGPQRYPECLQVLREGFATVADSFGLTADNTPSNPAFWAQDAVAEVVERGFELIADERDGVILGCAFVGPSADPTVWSLRHLAVAPDARHQGIGESLVAAAADRAHSAGAARLRIGIIAENLVLAQWYHRLGFVTVRAGVRYPSLVFTVDYLELAL